MARFLLPSPLSARRLLFGDGPKVGLPPSPVPTQHLSLPSLPSLPLARAGGLQHYQKELEDSQALAMRFRQGLEVRDLLNGPKSPVKRPPGRPVPVGILKKLPGSLPGTHARHVSFGDVNVREIENCLEPRPLPHSPPPPPPPPRPAPIGILKKRSGSMPGSYPRGVSFGDVTVREIENCLVPARPFPPPPYALFPAVKGRHPLSRCVSAVEAPRQSHRKYLVEYTSRPPRRGAVIGIAAAMIGVSLLWTWWTCG